MKLSHVITPYKYINDGSDISWERWSGDLEGCPNRIEGDLFASNCELTSLEGCATFIGKNLIVHDNMLKSLKVSRPIYVDGAISAAGNRITSLVGVEEWFLHAERILLSSNNITEGGVGLLLIPGITTIPEVRKPGNVFDGKVVPILNKYITQYQHPEDRIYACQKELIDTGLEAFAQL